jgi:hypothetical protein
VVAGDPAAAGGDAAAASEDAADAGERAGAARPALILAHRVRDALEDLALGLTARDAALVVLIEVDERDERWVLIHSCILLVMRLVTVRWQ